MPSLLHVFFLLLYSHPRILWCLWVHKHAQLWVNLFIYVLYGQLQAVVSLLMDVGAGIQACVFHNAWALSPTWGSPIFSEDQFLVTGLLLSSHKDSLRVEGCAIHVKLFHQGERITNLKSLCLYDTESQKTPPANPKKHPKLPTNQNKTKILRNKTSKATLYQTLYITYIYIYILEHFWHCKDIEKPSPQIDGFFSFADKCDLAVCFR